MSSCRLFHIWRGCGSRHRRREKISHLRQGEDGSLRLFGESLVGGPLVSEAQCRIVPGFSRMRQVLFTYVQESLRDRRSVSSPVPLWVRRGNTEIPLPICEIRCNVWSAEAWDSEMLDMDRRIWSVLEYQACGMHCGGCGVKRSHHVVKVYVSTRVQFPGFPEASAMREVESISA